MTAQGQRLADQIDALIRPMTPGEHVEFIQCMGFSIVEIAARLVMTDQRHEGAALGTAISTIGMSAAALGAAVQPEARGREIFLEVAKLLNEAGQ